MTTWVIRGGEGNRLVDTMSDGGFTGLGYYEVPDATALSRSEIEVGVRAWGHSAAPERHALMLWAFVHDIAVGDHVLMPDTAHGDMLVGQIEGSYEYVEHVDTAEYRHRRSVRWAARVALNELHEADQALHRQRQSLRRVDSPTLRTILDPALAGDLGRAPTDRSVSRMPRRDSASAAEPVGRVCPSCFIRKHPAQFVGDLCNECA